MGDIQFSMVLDPATEAVIIPELHLTQALNALQLSPQGGVRPLHMLGCCQACGRNRGNQVASTRGEVRTQQ